MAGPGRLVELAPLTTAAPPLSLALDEVRQRASVPAPLRITAWTDGGIVMGLEHVAARRRLPA
ncbi:MAG: hypothetical protein ABI401_16760 [Candidatus Dormibacter sp.]